MHDVSKYVIHARFAADGVIEQSDVVGAIYGQTEGLLGDRLDFRSLQDASKLGRISVEIQAAGGQSTGTFTLPASLDSVRTAIIAATLETIDQIGPCSAQITVETIEDVREAKRSWIVDRATELLHEGFGDGLLDADEILHEVEEAVRIEQITAYEGYPAGPNVVDSDAVILVEGRADVVQLLRSGVKNAVAVEGTDIPDELIDLTRHRTTTVFFDADRGGELLRRELAQRGAADYVARAPEGRSVEDLSRKEVHDALRHKLPVGMADAPESVDRGEPAPAEAPFPQRRPVSRRAVFRPARWPCTMRMGREWMRHRWRRFRSCWLGCLHQVAPSWWAAPRTKRSSMRRTRANSRRWSRQMRARWSTSPPRSH
jgi:DNA primase (EC 2.7.7.-)